MQQLAGDQAAFVPESRGNVHRVADMERSVLLSVRGAPYIYGCVAHLEDPR